jgi:hypothetical protein
MERNVDPFNVFNGGAVTAENVSSLGASVCRSRKLK